MSDEETGRGLVHIGTIRLPDDRRRHVFIDGGRTTQTHGSGSKVKPDTQPTYKMRARTEGIRRGKTKR